MQQKDMWTASRDWESKGVYKEEVIRGTDKERRGKKDTREWNSVN